MPSFYNEGMNSFITFDEQSIAHGTPCCGMEPLCPKPHEHHRKNYHMPCACGCGCGKRRGCIRFQAPQCPMNAVIPSVVVESVENLKQLSDCFVHVTNINTTFYIDDKHRMIITWAGPVEFDNYDYMNNPLKLRSQAVYDFANSRVVYYNKVGEYRVTALTEE